MSRQKAAAAATPPEPIEFRNAVSPWPDKPEIPALHPFEPDDFPDSDSKWGWEGDFNRRFEPPSREEIDDTNTRMLRRQQLFRWAAQLIAVAASEVTELQKLAAFGAVACPLGVEVPRFSEYRRHRISVLHECADLDLAFWISDFGRLNDLQKAMKRGLSLVHETEYGGVAHHQVDAHLMDAQTGDYRGRLCIFKECPKPGKRQCFVAGCGASPFLQQFDGYKFRRSQFDAAPKVILFERASGFLVNLPEISR